MKLSAKFKTLLKKMPSSRPSPASSNKAGQKVSSITHRKFKTTFLSKKSLHSRKLHSSLLGVQACQRRAKEVFYWPGMYKQIEEYASKCHVCNTYYQGQQREPMISHPVPSRPWQVLAVDLLELQGQDYLVTTDYYSNFFEVDKLVSKTSKDPKK